MTPVRVAMSFLPLAVFVLGREVSAIMKLTRNCFLPLRCTMGMSEISSTPFLRSTVIWR